MLCPGYNDIFTWSLPRLPLRTRTPGTADLPPPQHSAFSGPLRRSLPFRQHTRALVHVGPRNHRHLSRRLLWHFDGCPGYELPLQCDERADVLWIHNELLGNCVVVWETRWGSIDSGGLGGLSSGIEVRGSVYEWYLCEKREGKEEGVGGRILKSGRRR